MEFPQCDTCVNRSHSHFHELVILVGTLCDEWYVFLPASVTTLPLKGKMFVVCVAACLPTTEIFLALTFSGAKNTYSFIVA